MAIVGAGIGGLAAAHRLQILSRARECPLEIVVIEAAERAGGLLGTEVHEGALLEHGPDALVTHKPAGIELCRALGLGGRLVYPPPGHSDVLHDGRLLRIPEGFALLAPTRRWPLLRSPLLSWRGKWRALAEPRVPRALRAQEIDGGDESVASFVRRRFGPELLEHLVEPIVGGIYMADVEHLSLAATFPRFLALERDHGSIGTGLRQALVERARGAEPTKSGGAVATLTAGLGQIVDALLASLPPGALRLSTRVEGLARDGEGFRLRLADGRSLAAAAVLLATPGSSAGPLLRDLDATFAWQVSEIAYASCATVNLGWPCRAVAEPPRSHGFFVPRGAGSAVVAAGFVSAKYPERVQGDQVVARAFLGGAWRPEVFGHSDAELIELAADALRPLLGLREPPTWARVFRHGGAMPQLAVGHLARMMRLRARLAEHPGLELAGGPVGAYGLPDSIAAGESAAARLLDWVAARRS